MRCRGRLPHLLVGSGLVLLAGVGVAIALSRGSSPPSAVTTRAAPPVAKAPATAPAPTAPAPVAVQAVAVSPSAIRITWPGGGLAAIGLQGQPPTLWASGGDAVVGGLSFTAAYDVHAAGATVTVQPAQPGSGTATTADGDVLLAGQPFFPLLLWGQCPSYDGLLSAGISVFLNNPCGGIDAQVGALAGRGLSLAEASPTAAAGTIGSYYPDEADAHGFTAANLPQAQGLRFLTLSNHFYSAADPLPAGRSMYPGLVAAADVVGFDLYPLQNWCRRSALPDVYAAQRELVSLAAGKPTFQWIETAHMDCPFADTSLAVTPATVRAEAWLALTGGAHGLGFFPIGWTGGVDGAIQQVGRDVKALGPALLAPETPVSASGPVKVAARSYGGAFYVFAVNPTYAPVQTTIRAPGLDGRTLQVLGEGRSVTPAGGAFADTFGPLAVHLYVAAPG
ncbi:MAG: hypothetical protein ACR2MU_02200 [Gaiellaceae bacterium]